MLFSLDSKLSRIYIGLSQFSDIFKKSQGKKEVFQGVIHSSFFRDQPLCRCEDDTHRVGNEFKICLTLNGTVKLR